MEQEITNIQISEVKSFIKESIMATEPKSIDQLKERITKQLLLLRASRNFE